MRTLYREEGRRQKVGCMYIFRMRAQIHARPVNAKGLVHIPPSETNWIGTCLMFFSIIFVKIDKLSKKKRKENRTRKPLYYTYYI